MLTILFFLSDGVRLCGRMGLLVGGGLLCPRGASHGSTAREEKKPPQRNVSGPSCHESPSVRPAQSATSPDLRALGAIMRWFGGIPLWGGDQSVSCLGSRQGLLSMWSVFYWTEGGERLSLQISHMWRKHGAVSSLVKSYQ